MRRAARRADTERYETLAAGPSLVEAVAEGLNGWVALLPQVDRDDQGMRLRPYEWGL
jgi:hypothetical protein